jgi:hypothetical protein
MRVGEGRERQEEWRSKSRRGGIEEEEWKMGNATSVRYLQPDGSLSNAAFE